MNWLVVPTIPAGVATLIGPVVAALGAVAMISFGESTSKPAVAPLNFTAMTSVKFVPRTVTRVPAKPLAGEKLAMRGAAMNLILLTAVPVAVVTLIGPVIALSGTTVMICVGAVTVKLALVPPNFTAVVPVKLMPSIMTLAPGNAAAGEKLVMIGESDVTIKLFVLVPVPLGVVTRMGPEWAPVGTTTEI